MKTRYLHEDPVGFAVDPQSIILASGPSNMSWNSWRAEIEQFHMTMNPSRTFACPHCRRQDMQLRRWSWFTYLRLPRRITTLGFVIRCTLPLVADPKWLQPTTNSIVGPPLAWLSPIHSTNSLQAEQLRLKSVPVIAGSLSHSDLLPSLQ